MANKTWLTSAVQKQKRPRPAPWAFLSSAGNKFAALLPTLNAPALAAPL